MNAGVSFIVTAREEPPAVLAATIDGLLSTSGGHEREIVLVDDASTAPVGLVRPHLRVVRNPTPVGVAQSRRRGVKLAEHDILVVCDAHMSFAPDWLDHMLAYVESDSLLCAAWWNYELSRPVCWGSDFGWCGQRDYQTGRTPGFVVKHRTRFPGDGAVEVPMALGACYMMRRRVYDRSGGFSPFFRIWGKSEQDLSARMWITGAQVKCVTRARVGHLSRKTFPYPVRFSDIEFNQAVMLRTIFETSAVEELLRPFPAEVENWLAEVDLSEWREWIQSHRKMSDAEFFRRFLPEINYDG